MEIVIDGLHKSTIDIQVPHNIGITFDWANDEQACLDFESEDGGFVVSLIISINPDNKNEPYARMTEDNGDMFLDIRNGDPEYDYCYISWKKDSTQDRLLRAALEGLFGPEYEDLLCYEV